MSFLATQYGFVGRWLKPGRDTIGALDLGGASTQITFETSEKVEDKDNVMELKLYGQTYRLYTQSFLCYGQDQFLRKLLAYLITVQFHITRCSWFTVTVSFLLTTEEVRGQDQLNGGTQSLSRCSTLAIKMFVWVLGLFESCPGWRVFYINYTILLHQSCLKGNSTNFTTLNCVYRSWKWKKNIKVEWSLAITNDSACRCGDQ